MAGEQEELMECHKSACSQDGEQTTMVALWKKEQHELCVHICVRVEPVLT